MADTPKLTSHEEVIREIERLRDLAKTGELTGFMVVLMMADGTRKEFIGGTVADDTPAELESMREVLNAIQDGEDPADGATKH